MNQYVLMTYYVKYLKEIRKVSDSTVKHYQQALRSIYGGTSCIANEISG